MSHNYRGFFGAPAPRIEDLNPLNAARYAAAADPATPPEELRRIAGLKGHRGNRKAHWYEQAAVAENPNTPAEVLIDLLSGQPAAVCRNPILPLLLLEMPERFLRLAPVAAKTILQQPDVPLPLVQFLAGAAHLDRGTVAEEGRLHVALAGEIPDTGDAFAAVRDYWRIYVDRDVSWTVRQAHIELVEQGMAPEWIAGPKPWPGPGERMTAARLIGLAKDPKIAEQIREASNPQTETGRLVELSKIQNPDIKEALGINPGAPRAILREIRYGEPHQRALAFNPGADGIVATELLCSTRYPWVRRILWQRPGMAATLGLGIRRFLIRQYLDRATGFLAGDHYPLAEFIVLLQPETRRSIVRESACVPLWHRRLAAALALPMPESEPILRTRLMHDGNRLVRAAARARLAGATFRLDDF